MESGVGGIGMRVLEEGELARLREQITEYSGLDASAFGSDALQQAVAHRLAARTLDRYESYWPLVQPDSGNGEIEQLVQILTNKETFFFREDHHFEALHSQILPTLLAAGRSRRLRLWSAGCATGEEPYSLAITLLQYQARHGFFEAEIVATDIDAAALQVARRGCYGQRSLRLVPDLIRQRYFRSQGEHYCILPEVARMVTFRTYNLAEECCPEGGNSFDLIFCRNVSIYFHPAARDRLNALLAAALREGGYLFVASAETMSHNLGRLDLVSLGNTFLFRKAVASFTPANRAPVAPGVNNARSPVLDKARWGVSETALVSEETGRVLSPVPWDAGSKAARATEAGRASQTTGRVLSPVPSSRVPSPVPRDTVGKATDPLQEALHAFQQHDFERALQQLDRLSGGEYERLDVRCLRAAVFLQQEKLQDAEMLCQEVLARDPWHADAHMLLGLIYRQQGEVDAAVRSLKQAIYLYPDHRDAHFFLAETYRSLGLEAQARSEYENTLNILATRAASQPGDRGRPHFPLTGLPDQALHHACQANLRSLRLRQEAKQRGLDQQGRHGA